MQLSAGDKLGPYEILAPIGAGGMGEVWKARDTRLDRSVAVKISNEEFSARFEREARAVAALNHPHICQLYDVGPNYLVMECIEGKPLKGPLPIEKAVEYAGQILDALDAAHRMGIMHRDLKPANILVTKHGIKLLDFGLAKHIAPLKETDAPLTLALTAQWEVVGTPQYMSPEQLQGNQTDARTDLFAFGCVLYEMLMGKRAFEGESTGSVMAAILEREPAPLTAAPALERVVRRSLAKDPDQRFQTARDLKAALTWASEQASLPAAAKPGHRWPGIAAAALAIGVLLGALGAVLFRRPVREEPLSRVPLRYVIPAPEDSNVHSFAVSPDGRLLAIAGVVQGKNLLWIRALDALQAQVLPGTEGAPYPFWSPDSRYVAFFADGKLKKVAAGGGPAQPLCDAPRPRGGSWNRDDVIIFAPEPTTGIKRVAALGGTPVGITKAKRTDRFPVFLPDGHHFLHVINPAPPEEAGVWVASLDGKDDRRVMADVSSVAYASPALGERYGSLLFLREDTLMAQPFDLNRYQQAGDVFPVAEHVSFGGSFNLALVSVSGNGVLVYVRTASSTAADVDWLDRTGKLLGQLLPSGGYWQIAISPDEKTAAYARFGNGNNSDIWLNEFSRGTDMRLTTAQASQNIGAVWSPKGDRLVFSSDRDGGPGHLNLYQRASSGAGQDELLCSTPNSKVATSWSSDGRYIAYSEADPKTKLDLWVLPMDGPPENRKPVAFLKTEFNETEGQFSPDGHWMAYTSDESGVREVYVRPFPAAEGRWKISVAGGEEPRWRRDGKEIFFLRADGKLAAASVKATPGPKPTFGGEPAQALFDPHISPQLTNQRAVQYDVAPNGQKFLVVRGIGTTLGTPLTVEVNWMRKAKTN